MQNMKEQTAQVNKLEHKWIKANVVGNVDPLKAHRIQITVPTIPALANTPVWAAPDSIHGGSGGGDETQDIPAIGSQVYVKFQQGDLHFPLYRGAAIVAGGLPTLGGDPSIYGIKRGVITLTENKVTGEIKLTCPNFTLHVDAAGNMTVTGAGSLTAQFQSALFQIPTSTFTGDVTIQGNLVVDKTATVQQQMSANGGFTAANGQACTLPTSTTVGGINVYGHVHYVPGTPGDTNPMSG